MHTAATLLSLTVLLAGQAQAKDCPSDLPSHTAAVGDWAELGAELRSVTVAMSPGDDLATPDPDGFDLAFMEALRGLAILYPSDALTIVAEPEVRYKNPGWEDGPLPGLWPMRINQALVEVDTGKLGLDVGIQNLAWGSGALLDVRALGVSAQYSTKPVKLGLFAAMSRQSMLRNSEACLWYRYAAARNGWKSLSENPRDNPVLGADLSIKKLGAWRIKGLYLASLTQNEALRGHFLALSTTGPLVERRVTLAVEPVMQLHDGSVSAGAVGMLRMTLFDGDHAPHGRVGFASSFTEADPVASVWEGLSWGYLRRYSIHDGHIGMLRIAWPVNDWLKPKLQYHVQSAKLSDGAAGDELDLGVELKLAELYRAHLSLVGLDLAGPLEPSLGGFVEIRLIAGER